MLCIYHFEALQLVLSLLVLRRVLAHGKPLLQGEDEACVLGLRGQSPIVKGRRLECLVLPVRVPLESSLVRPDTVNSGPEATGPGRST